MRAWASLFALSAGLASPAWGHGNIQGVNDFYAGILHPLLVPAHWLTLLVGGLLLAQRGRVVGQWLLAGLLLGLIIGLGACALWAPSGQLLVLGCLAAGLGLGLMVVMEYRCGPRLLMALGLICGFLIGLDSSQTRSTWGAVLAVFAGTGFGALLLVCVVGGALLELHKPWQRIALRVAGAWISAACLLVLTLEIGRLG